MAISTYLKRITLAGRLAVAETLFLFCISGRASSQRSLSLVALAAKPAEVSKSEPSKLCASLMRAPSPDVKVQVKWFMLLSAFTREKNKLSLALAAFSL